VKVLLRLAGFPQIVRRVGSDEVEVAFPGNTLGDLLQWFQETHGIPTRTAVLDRAGQLDQSIQVLRNGVEWISRDETDRVLVEGDEVTLLVLVAGG
jgi:molybdopterin converting factor small subunit